MKNENCKLGTPSDQLTCYNFIGSLEWVGRLLALLFEISNLTFQTEAREESPNTAGQRTG